MARDGTETVKLNFDIVVVVVVVVTNIYIYT